MTHSLFYRLRIVPVTLLFVAIAAWSQELRVRYTFDEPAGNAVDSSGFAPSTDALLFGGATRTSDTPNGFSAGALSLAGAGSRYAGTASDLDKVDGLGSFTFTTWLKLIGTPSVTDRLLVDSSTALESSFQILFVNPSAGAMAADNFRLQLTVFDTTAPVSDKLLSPDLNASQQWVFLAATVDAANQTGEFFLGTTAGSVQSVSSGPLNQVIGQNFAPLILGGSGTSFLDATPPALLDDVRIYSGAADALFLETVRLQNVPEPRLLAILGLGTAILGWRAWRAKFKVAQG